MKKYMLALFLLLVGSPLLAQIGSPGITNPPATVSAGLPIALEAGATISGTAETILFKLDGDSAATQAFLSFTNVAGPTKIVSLTQNGILPSFTATAEDSDVDRRARLVLDVDDGGSKLVFSEPVAGDAGTVEVRADAVSASLVGTSNTTPGFELSDVVSNTFLSFTNVATPANTITMAQDSSVPSLTTTVTDGTTVNTIVNENSTFQQTITNTGSGANVTVSYGPTGRQDTISDGATNSIDMSWEPSTPSLTTTVTDGTTTQATTLDVNGLLLPTKVFANLGTPADGYILYCSDCAIAAVCVGAGTGALAKRLGGVWVCN